MTMDLFESPQDLRIVRVGSADASVLSDNLVLLRNKIIESDPAYPGIAKWFDKKVLSGLKSGERFGYAAILNGRPIVSAIVKKGQRAKFCHLKIESEYRNLGLGDLFFSLMALDLRGWANQVHFTLPESLWESKAPFFKSFGFSDVVRSERQYRLFDPELAAAANYKSISQSVRAKLQHFVGLSYVSGFALDSKLVMTMKPAFAEKVMLGKKRVEIRRRFSKNWEGCRTNIYASSPVQALMGEVRISRVFEGTPNSIWTMFGSEIGCEKHEFDTYAGESQTIYALVLSDVKPYMERIPLEQVNHLLGIRLAPPQSYGVIAPNDDWHRAISIAAMLQREGQRQKFSIETSSVT